MGMAQGLWSTAWFMATSSGHWLPGRALPWTGPGAPSHPARLWSGEGAEGWNDSPSHTAKVARAAWLQLQALQALRLS